MAPNSSRHACVWPPYSHWTYSNDCVGLSICSLKRQTGYPAAFADGRSAQWGAYPVLDLLATLDLALGSFVSWTPVQPATEWLRTALQGSLILTLLCYRYSNQPEIHSASMWSDMAGKMAYKIQRAVLCTV